MKNFDDFIEFITPKKSENPEELKNSLITIQATLDLLRQYHNWVNEQTPSQD